MEVLLGLPGYIASKCGPFIHLSVYLSIYLSICLSISVYEYMITSIIDAVEANMLDRVSRMVYVGSHSSVVLELEDSHVQASELLLYISAFPDWPPSWYPVLLTVRKSSFLLFSRIILLVGIFVWVFVTRSFCKGFNSDNNNLLKLGSCLPDVSTALCTSNIPQDEVGNYLGRRIVGFW